MKIATIACLSLALVVAARAHCTSSEAGSSGVNKVRTILSGSANRHASTKPPTPFFHLLWKEEISELALRAAVGDTTGDGKPRLILLVEKPQQAGLATLVIKKWNGAEFTTEFTGDVDAAPDKLVVGHFAGKDKPAVIVTADALWSWNGSTYLRKPARKPISIFGAARMHSGDERVIVNESASVFKSYAVNAASPDDWLTDRTEAPTGTQVDWESMRAAPDFFNKMGMPSFLGGGGLITIWDTSRVNLPYLYYCRPARELDTPNAAPRVNSYIAFRDATEAGGNELWSTVKLSGLATDLALEDARTPGKRGLLILSNSASAAGGKARTLYFYGLD